MIAIVRSARVRALGPLAAALTFAVACDSGKAPEQAALEAQAAPSAPPPSGQQGPTAAEFAEKAMKERAQAVARAVNPDGLPPYSGPVGTIRGRVLIQGDPPPAAEPSKDPIPSEGCQRAHELYGKLFRRGPEGTLADALVTVTEYKGFLPSVGEAIRVEAKGCAWNSRTFAMTFGQRLDIYNLDSQGYIPRLEGVPVGAFRLALPNGSPVPLFVPKPGQYTLVEQVRDYMRADVFVLQYPTARVTELDGRFELEGIPAGEVRVTAYLPVLQKHVDRVVSVVAGAAQELELVLSFSRAEYDAQRAGAASPGKPAGDQGPK